jgi:virginiamycin A acetyltransferase
MRSLIKLKMSRISRYFRLRSYTNRLKWLKVFRNSIDSTIGRNSKIHSSSVIVNSILANNVSINKDVTVSESKIGNDCKILANTYLYKSFLGDFSYISMNSFVLRAKIGKFCSVASHVFIGPGSHPMEFVTTHPFTFLKKYGNFIDKDNEEIVYKRELQSIKIGNDVWIGQGALIMDNINIGDGAIIGAHSVVTENVEPYSIVIGVPAKIIRYRFSDEVIEALLRIKWWEWEPSKIKKFVSDFNDIESFVLKHNI